MRLALLFLIISFSVTFAQPENIRVSKEWSTDPEEVSIAINPANPDQLAAGANISYFYSSEDGGKTWSQKNLKSTYGVWGDPCVIYNGKGELFFGHLSNPDKNIFSNGYWIDRIVVQKSTDNGASWNNGVGVGFTSPKNQDKEWLAVDLTESDYSGNLYMAWTEFDDYGSYAPSDKSRILFSKSEDDGMTWENPVAINDVNGNCIDGDNTVEGAVPCVGPDGEVYISWAGPEGLVFDKSLDGGKTFGEDVFVSDIPGGWAFNVEGISRCNGLPITACDVSDSEYRGNIYINWSDQRNGTENTDIFLAKSEDGGQTWSEPKRVNTDNSGKHQFFTWMTIDQSTGYLYFVFYDRRDTEYYITNVYMAVSKDGGETFSNYRINERTFNPSQNIFFGDYTNVAAYEGKIYPIWMAMNNQKLSVWTSIIEEDYFTGVEESEPTDALRRFKLHQNYPNPFNPTTTIGYELNFAEYVEIAIYDVLGNKIDQVVKEYQRAGYHEVIVDSDKMPSGVYFYKLFTKDYKASRKMVVLK